MKTRFLNFVFCVFCLCGSWINPAVAQNAPVVPTVNQTDLVPIVPLGRSSAQTYFATVPQLSGIQGYQNLGAVVEGGTYTFSNSTVNMLAQPTANISVLKLVAAPSPSDGQMECFFSTQAIVGLIWNANTGQSINGAPASGVANGSACMLYVKSANTWYRVR